MLNHLIRKKSLLKESLWNIGCAASLIGIWPRFIEPNLVLTTRLLLSLPSWPKKLNGIKIVQISDLHFQSTLSKFLLEKIVKKIRIEKPDLVVFTGDFLCRSELFQPERLQEFLSKISAPYGCYAIAGNHDYSAYISLNKEGEYDVMREEKSLLDKGFNRLFKKSPVIKKTVTPQALQVPLHVPLMNLLSKTPFTLLHNQTIQVCIKNSVINVCGLGDYTAGRCLPSLAYENYRVEYPGIVLTHNPDSLCKLRNYPGELVLCGHTHGAQINIPFLYKKFMLSENPGRKRGLYSLYDKWVYINRGLGSIFPFRWCSPPEILSLTLLGEKDE